MENTDLFPLETRLEILELDPPLNGLGICPIEECPNEVLLVVAAALEQKDLTAFALDSRRFARVAQDVMYRTAAPPPARDHDHDTDGDDCDYDCDYDVDDLVSGVSMLLRTIYHRPDFAKKLQCLELRMCR